MKRYSTEEKKQILNDLAASDQSRAAFCRERALSYKRVCSWVYAQSQVESTPRTNLWGQSIKMNYKFF
jgi:hypothetical protein